MVSVQRKTFKRTTFSAKKIARNAQPRKYISPSPSLLHPHPQLKTLSLICLSLVFIRWKSSLKSLSLNGHHTQNSIPLSVLTWWNTNVSSSISYSNIFLFNFLIKLNKEIRSLEKILSWFKFLKYNGYEISVSLLWSTDRIKSSQKQKDVLAPVNQGC